MTKGQRLKALVDTKIQGKSFKAETVFEIIMGATDHEKENHLIAVVGKNGKVKTTSNPKNFVGINQKQIDFAILNQNIEVLA